MGQAGLALYIRILAGDVEGMEMEDGFIKNFTSVNALINTVSQSVRVVAAREDEEQQDLVRQIPIEICAQMDQAGEYALAEYTRAWVCLEQAAYRHSAMAYMSAKWHLLRMEERIDEADADARANLVLATKDIYEEFEKQDRKLGGFLRSELLDNKAPELEKDYPDGCAPVVEDCEKFMDFAADICTPRASAPVEKTSAATKKKGLFGNLFGR